MATVLRGLEHTMDPLIAAQVYNNRHCPLTSLPEEILLLIIGNIEGDVPTLHCLQRTSRTFRRLITSAASWSHIMNPFLGFQSTLGEMQGYDLPWYERDELAYRLWKDGMCDKCVEVTERPGSRWHTRLLMWLFDCDLIPWAPRRSRSLCRFGSRRASDWLWCDACWRQQDVHSFSVSNRGPFSQIPRFCLGWQGAVQLCEHVHIRWADIARHVTKWQPSNPGDWQACFDAYGVECQHPSHDTRCTPNEEPNWPRARLRAPEENPEIVVLDLEWSPHSGLRAFTRSHDGRPPIEDFRKLFRTYRQGTGGIFMPSYPSKRMSHIDLPEMACFKPGSCMCANWESGDNEALGVISTVRPADFFRQDPWWNRKCSALHIYYRRIYGGGYNGEQVEMHKHWPTEDRDGVCLVTTYKRDIMVCVKAEVEAMPHKRISPTHEFFHAMNPDTYDLSDPDCDLPMCKNRACTNYYRRPKVFYCPAPGPFEGYDVLARWKSRLFGEEEGSAVREPNISVNRFFRNP